MMQASEKVRPITLRQLVLPASFLSQDTRIRQRGDPLHNPNIEQLVTTTLLGILALSAASSYTSA